MASAAKRAEVIRQAFENYHAGKITLAELYACLRGMRDNGIRR